MQPGLNASPKDFILAGLQSGRRALSHLYFCLSLAN
jgi:hypothetical protein